MPRPGAPARKRRSLKATATPLFFGLSKAETATVKRQDDEQLRNRRSFTVEAREAQPLTAPHMIRTELSRSWQLWLRWQVRGYRRCGCRIETQGLHGLTSLLLVVILFLFRIILPPQHAALGRPRRRQPLMAWALLQHCAGTQCSVYRTCLGLF